MFVASAIAAGYSTLCLSGFSFHVHLGALVALAMGATLFAGLPGPARASGTEYVAVSGRTYTGAHAADCTGYQNSVLRRTVINRSYSGNNCEVHGPQVTTAAAAEYRCPTVSTSTEFAAHLSPTTRSPVRISAPAARPRSSIAATHRSTHK